MSKKNISNKIINEVDKSLDNNFILYGKIIIAV